MRRPLIPSSELATLLGVSQKTLERWRVEGGGPPFVKAPGTRGAVRYDLDAVERWIRARERRSTSDLGEIRPPPAA